MIKQRFGAANVGKTTGEKRAEYGSSACHIASALALTQKHTLEVEQRSIPANVSGSSEVVSALQD